MRLDAFIKTLPDGAASLFDASKEYPAPFDTLGVHIAAKAVRDFGGLTMYHGIKELTLTELQGVIWEELCLSQYQIEAYNKILDAMAITADDPDYKEIRTYGKDESSLTHGQNTVTSNVGARSSADVMGATDGTTTNTDTSYETTTGKQTTTAHTITAAINNTSSSAAATDSTVTAEHTDVTTRSEHEDIIERFHNVGEDAAPDYIKKWLAIKNTSIIVVLEKIIVDALTIPYYED